MDRENPALTTNLGRPVPVALSDKLLQGNLGHGWVPPGGGPEGWDARQVACVVSILSYLS